MSRVGVDIGGTHTDIVVVDGGAVHVRKVPSNNAEPAEAVRRGIEALGISLADVELFAHGTTVATNAVIQRNGELTGLITTAGFRDVLQIRRTTRGELYDFRWDPPAELVPRRLRCEAEERIAADGEVLVPVDEEEVVRTAAWLREQGVRSLAIAFVNSYVNPVHEERCRDAIAAALPDLGVYLSAELLPEWREFERTSTAVVGAYVGPVLTAYLRRLEAGLVDAGLRYELMVMRSNGGLATADSAIANPVSTLMSGPAAGVIAQVALAAESGIHDLVGMDVGGTSTDVSVVLDGEPQMRDEFDVEFGTVVRFPMIDIHSIGAGGGTIAWLDEGGMLHAGPRSAGAEPGPVAYRRGGTEPTLTDAHLALGRLNPAGLLGGELEISKVAAEDAIAELGGRVGLGKEEMAAGIVTLAVTNIAAAIREITVERGVDPRGLTLVAYGGGGPNLACEVAAELGMTRILVPPYPGLTSAAGLLLTDIRHDIVRTYLRRDDECGWEEIAAAFDELAAEGTARLAREGIPPERREFELAADLRYLGQTHELGVSFGSRYDEGIHRSLSERLREAHLARFGYAPDDEGAVELVSLRVAATGVMSRPRFEIEPAEGEPRAVASRELFLGGTRRTCPVFRRPELAVGSRVEGPALIEQLDTTTFLADGWVGRTEANGSLILESGARG